MGLNWQRENIALTAVGGENGARAGGTFAITARGTGVAAGVRLVGARGALLARYRPGGGLVTLHAHCNQNKNLSVGIGIPALPTATQLGLD